MQLIKKNNKKSPELVIFDSFIAEEYFSHYMYKYFPGAVRVLDTQDLHFLRKLRERNVLEKLHDNFSLDNQNGKHF